MILFSLSLGQLDRRIRCKSGRDCLSLGANQVEIGDWRSFLPRVGFSGFQSFQEDRILEMGEEVEDRQRDRFLHI